MRNLSAFFFLLFLVLCSPAAAQNKANSHEAPFKQFFEEAYQVTQYRLPKGILEAMAWAKTRIRNIQPDQEAASCIGMPKVYGPMGLVADGQGYFINTLSACEAASSFSAKDIAENPRSNILAVALSLEDVLQSNLSLSHNLRESIPQLLGTLCEIPHQTPYARDLYLYEALNFLSQPEMQAKYHFPDHRLDLPAILGEENYKVLSAQRVTLLPGGGARASNGSHYQAGQALMPSPDYPPALWDPAPTCNYSSRSGTPVSAITIHTTQGSYAGAISWFKNCNSNVSAHYVIRSSDGQVTQMVRESDKGWHVGSENPYTIGLEHEGYVSDPAWYTNEMYTASADLVKDILNGGYGIDPLKTYAGPGHQGIVPLGTNCYKIKGHQHFPNQSHVDPGPNWDWARFYEMINTPLNPTVYAACSGSFYDTGGASGNYGDQERQSWRIAPGGATSVTLNFTAFDLENGYDYLWIYDGPDSRGDLLGKFDGAMIPGPLTANSGQMYVEFRSDCATTRSGWAANWNCNQAAPGCGMPLSVQATPNPFGVELNWGAVSGATSYEVRLRNSLESGWTTYASAGNSYSLFGLKSSSLYYYQVRSLCGATQSAWVGGDFHTPQAGSVATQNCTGVFRDSGGDLGNYKNAESYTFTISPVGASSISLSFSSFELEANYDFLEIYDGINTAAPLLGSWTGNNSPGTVTSSGGALTVRFTSDSWTTKPGWEANWQCAANLAPFTAIAPFEEWQADDFTVNISDQDNSGSGLKSRFYQVLDFNGIEWDCNRGNGFAFETFENGFSRWNAGAGNAYILNGALHQTDTLTTNTNFYLDVGQNASHTYLYHLKTRLWSGTTNRRMGIHIMADNPLGANRGNSYLIWFRGDNQTVQIYETINDQLNTRVTQPTTVAPFVWYDIKITYNPGSGLIEVYQEDQKVATWTDSSPLLNGSFISLRSNQAHCDFDNVRVYKSRGASVIAKVGPASTEDVRFQNPDPQPWHGEVHALAVDNADNWSNSDFKRFKVDWTVPSSVNVSDGAAADIDTFYSSSQILANWTASVDTNSGVQDYEVALGTSPLATDVLSWQSVGDTLATTLNGLNLQHAQLYFVSVRAKNLSRLYSNPLSSDGQLLWAPMAAATQPVSPEVIVWPNPVRDFVHIKNPSRQALRYALYASDGRLVISEETNSNGLHRINLKYLAAGLYFLNVTAEGAKARSFRILKQD